MSPHITGSQVGIVATKTLTLILGGLIVYYAYKAYQRTGAPELRALTWGFAIVTFGTLLGGVIDLGVRTVVQQGLFGLPPSASGDFLVMGVFAQSALTAVGFAVVLYSLFVD